MQIQKLKALFTNYHKEYPLQTLKDINQLIKSTKQNDIKETIINLVIHSNIVTDCICLITKKKDHFSILFTGFVKECAKKIQIPQVLEQLIYFYCGNIQNIDDLIKIRTVKLISLISTCSKNKTEYLAQHDHLINTLSSMLKGTETIHVTRRLIFTFSNVVADHEDIIQKVISCNEDVTIIVEILLKFMNDFEKSTLTTELFLKKFDYTFADGDEANKFRKHFRYSTMTEIIRIIWNFKIVVWFKNVNTSTKLKIIQLLSITKNLHRDIYQHYFINMIYMITLGCYNFSNDCINALHDGGVYHEIVKFLKHSILKPKNQYSHSEYYALRTICCIIDAYPLKIDKSKLTNLIQNGLLFVLKKILIITIDDSKQRDELFNLIISCAIKILYGMIKDFEMVCDLFKYSKIVQFVCEITMRINVKNEHFQDFIKLICNAIIYTEEDEILQYFHDKKFINFMFGVMISKETNIHNLKLISYVLRKITEKFDENIDVNLIRKI